jgi:glutamine amidotransferase PdxT
VVRQGKMMACSFHPEIAGDARLHELWLSTLDNAQEHSSPEEHD